MAYYFARFEEISGHLFRFDTRIYLTGLHPDEGSVCVGAIIGKNPGSASPTELNRLAPLNLNGDKMLPTVRSRFLGGYNLAGKPLPINAYIQVWNLFYLCNSNLTAAVKTASTMSSLPTCATEVEAVPVVWYGWGGTDRRLNLYKARFIERRFGRHFFYNKARKNVEARAPAPEEFAKHPQGMPAGPVEEYLATCLK